MEGLIAKSSLLNVYTAADAVVATGTLTITGLMKIKTASITSMTKQICVPEMSQIVQIGTSSTPTVTAATKYQVKIGNTGNRREGAQSQLLSFGYTSPFVLTGVAASDRHNLFTSLANKINRTQSVFATAYALVSLPYDTQAVANFVLGETVTGSSGAFGVLVSQEDNGTTGTLILGNVFGVFANNEALVGGTSGTTALANFVDAYALHTGFGLEIVDFPGYYATMPYDAQGGEYTVGLVVTGATSGATGRIIADVDGAGATGTLALAGVVGRFVDNETLTDTSTGTATTNIPTGWTAQTGVSIGNSSNGTLGYYGPYTGSFRRGPNTVLVTAGFATTDLVILATGVVSSGVGAKMVADVPVRELTSGNLAKGYWSFPTNNPPLPADHYTIYVITNTVSAFESALTDNATRHETVQMLYLDENIPNTGAGVNAGYVAITAVLDAFLV